MTQSLGSIYAQLMKEVRRGIERCDLSGCEAHATTSRFDDARHYSHPFCATHAAEWDAAPEAQR